MNSYFELRLKNIFYILFLLPILFSCQSEKNVTVYPNQVGDIVFDKNVDDSDFNKCFFEPISFQYYNFNGFPYKGEKFEVEKKLEELNLKSDKHSNGYVTIRFVVNCEGKTGMFRVQQMDENYKEKVFDKKIINQLLDFTKNLKDWIPQEYLGIKTNYYQYLTFKIQDGKISEVLP